MYGKLVILFPFPFPLKNGERKKGGRRNKTGFLLAFPKIRHQIYINRKLETPIRYFMSFSYRYLITKRC